MSEQKKVKEISSSVIKCEGCCNAINAYLFLLRKDREQKTNNFSKLKIICNECYKLWGINDVR